MVNPFVNEHISDDFDGFSLRFSSNSRKFPNLLITLNISNFFVFKYFLDRKKVLKSLEANSFISPQNYVIPARYHPKQHPNMWVGNAKIHLHHPICRCVHISLKIQKYSRFSYFLGDSLGPGFSLKLHTYTFQIKKIRMSEALPNSLKLATWVEKAQANFFL